MNGSSPMLSRLGLGTAQFGLDYGITNRNGEVSEQDAAVVGADP